MLQHIIDHKWKNFKLYLILYEKIGVDELNLLREYASVFGKGYKYHYYIFSKAGFTDNLLSVANKENVNLITLDDMYR